MWGLGTGALSLTTRGSDEVVSVGTCVMAVWVVGIDLVMDMITFVIDEDEEEVVNAVEMQ